MDCPFGCILVQVAVQNKFHHHLFRKIASWRPPGSISEVPRLDFGRLGGRFFRDFGPLDRRNAGTDFELEAKAAQLQLGTQVARPSTSKFGPDLLLQSQAEIFRRSGWAAVLPPGGFNGIEKDLMVLPST